MSLMASRMSIVSPNSSDACSAWRALVAAVFGRLRMCMIHQMAMVLQAVVTAVGHAYVTPTFFDVHIRHQCTMCNAACQAHYLCVRSPRMPATSASSLMQAKHSTACD